MPAKSAEVMQQLHKCTPALRVQFSRSRDKLRNVTPLSHNKHCASNSVSEAYKKSEW